MNADDPNIAALETVAAMLGDLRSELVLVGGCAVGLLITDPASAPVRETLDVDLIAEVTTKGEYYELRAKLEARGFKQAQDDSHMCGWTKDSFKLDVMPSNDTALGHSSNRWYPDAIATAGQVTLGNGLAVLVVSSPLFLATKLEAFFDRGGGDYVSSHDMEDIINVVDGRPELIAEVHAAPDPIRAHLREEFDELLANGSFVDAIPMHLRTDAASQARAPLIITRLRQLAGL